MKVENISALLVSLSLTLHPIGAQAESYTVQAGDTLSAIAQRAYGHGVYIPRSGGLARLIKMNPGIMNHNKIFPGMVILSEEEKRTPASAEAPAIAQREALAAVARDNPKAPAPLAREAGNAGEAIAPLAPEPKKKPRSRLGIDLGFKYFRLDDRDRSSGGSAVFISNMSPLVRFNWDLDWNERWASHIGLISSSESIQNATSTSSSIQTSKFLIHEFDFGAVRKWNEGSRTGFSLGSATHLFPRSPTATSVVFDRVPTLQAKVSHAQELLRVEAASAGVEGALKLHGAGRGPGYSADPGWGSDLGMYINHEISYGLSLKGQIFYGVDRKNTNLVEQRESQIGILLGISRSFGP